MKYPFSDIKAYYAAKRGMATFASMETYLQTAAIIQLNTLYNLIWYSKQYGFSGAKFQLTLVPPVTNTVSGTLGENILTFGTAVSASYYGTLTVGQYVQINNRMYRLLYRRSSTIFTVDRPLAETVSGVGCIIYFANYACPYNVGAIRYISFGLGEYLPYVPEYMTPFDQVAGTPNFAYNAGRSTVAFLDSGTVTTVNGSQNLVYSGTVTIAAIGKNLLLKVSSGFEYFKVIDVVTAGGVGVNYYVVDRPFTGTGASSLSFILDPVGTQLIGFKEFPAAIDTAEVAFTFAPNKLLYNNDLTLLPDDNPMMVGIEVIATKWETVGEGNINSVSQTAPLLLQGTPELFQLVIPSKSTTNVIVSLLYI